MVVVLYPKTIYWTLSNVFVSLLFLWCFTAQQLLDALHIQVVTSFYSIFKVPNSGTFNQHLNQKLYYINFGRIISMRPACEILN